MVDTTIPIGSSGAAPPSTGWAGAPEVTSAMIEAGLKALHESGAVEHPSGADEYVVRDVFIAMISASASAREAL
jgi:hypothetical protein